MSVQQAQTGDALADGFLTRTTIAAVTSSTEPEVTTAEADQVVTQVGKPALAAPITVRTGSSGSFELTPAMIGAALTFEPADGTLKPVLNPEKLTTAAAKTIKGWA